MAEQSKNNKKSDNGLTSAATIGVAQDISLRYGSAVKEHLVAYSGVDNETGKVLHDSLKSISEKKINPDFEKQNTRQQAGYAAEVLETAKSNAEAKIKGIGETKIRTDDMGKVNDPLVDHVVLDKDGNIIPGSQAQMKFVGNTPGQALDKLMSKKYQKYVDNDVKFSVPSDFYDDIKRIAEERIQKLEDQLKDQIAKGNTETADKIQSKIDKLKKINDNLQKSKVSNKEAEQAVSNPEKVTAVNVIKTAHEAGLESAKTAAAVAGVISVAKNTVEMIREDKKLSEAAKDVVKSTAGATAQSYVVGFSSSAISGAMSNSKSEIVRNVGKSSLPSMACMGAIESGKTLVRFINDDITKEECTRELATKNAGMIGSSIASELAKPAVTAASKAAGTALSKTAVSGIASKAAGIIVNSAASMVGYAIVAAAISIIITSFDEAKDAKEERKSKEAACEKLIRALRQYRAEMQQYIDEYFRGHYEVINDSFESIKQSLQLGDIDGFISSANSITLSLGKSPLFETFEQCDEIMLNSDSAIKI